MLNVSACPPGHKHSAPFKAITARQLQALVRHPAHGASLPLADMPTDACEIGQIDFTPPRRVGGTSEPDTRVGSIEAFSGTSLPPPIQIVNVEPNHEVLRKVVVVEPLEHELCTAVSEPSIAIVLPSLLQTKIRKDTATGLGMLAA